MWNGLVDFGFSVNELGESDCPPKTVAVFVIVFWHDRGHR
jgi:hypothetical protein